MRFGRRKHDPATTTAAATPAGLSVCCVTDRPPDQTAAALAPLRGVADELVIGLDATLEGHRAAYEALADRVIITPHGPIEGNLEAIHEACSQPWVLRIDADELVAPALIARLPELIASPGVQQYAIARRWLSPEGTAWYDEHLWSPDWQVRLVRRENARHPTTVHAPTPVVSPRVYLTGEGEAIYHAIAPLLSASERRRKMLEYEIVLLPGPSTLRQPTAIAYEPERHATRPPVAVPESDRDAIVAFLAAAPAPQRPLISGAGTASPVPAAVTVPSPALATADQPPRAPLSWTRSRGSVEDPTTEAGVELLDPPPPFASAEQATAIVRLTNRSGEPWQSGAARGELGHAVSYRWHLPDGTAEEGVRTLLPAPIEPGASVVLPIEIVGPSKSGPASLSVQIVLEQVRWLDGEGHAEVEVGPARPVPVARELHHPGVAPIPKILHRVWLGDNPLPDDYRAYGETWARHHPDWELKLWTEADAPSPPGTEHARSLSERSDLVRYAVLQQFGGVYVDTDVECLRPIDDLIAGRTAFAGYEVPGRVCGAVMGGLPGHPAFDELVDLAAMTTGEGHFPESVTTFVTYVLEAWPDVTLFHPSRFYPELWDDRANPGDEPPYTDHHWGQSWNPALHPSATPRD